MSTHELTSTNESGPVINPRTEHLMVFIDPLGIRKKVPYLFDLDVVDLVETTSAATASLAGDALKTSGIYTDYNTPGGSIAEVLDAARDFWNTFQGKGIDVTIDTTLSYTPVFFDEDKEPFYNRNVMVFRVPSNWYLQGHCDPFVGLRPRQHTYTVWKNGTFTPEHDALQQILAEASQLDCAGHRRTNR